jgi:hypothetical protein
VYATPFAFLIDEGGIIRSQGVVTSRKYLKLVLSAERPEKVSQAAAQPLAAAPAIAASEQ